MTKFIALVLTFIFICVAASAAECTDIAKVDFANRTLTVAGIQQMVTPAESPLGGPLAQQAFHFHHGVSLEYEGGPGKKPDWQTTIRQDVAVKPEGFHTIRFLTLFRNHLTGSGSWTHLVGLTCSGGRIQQVFQVSERFMQVEEVTPEVVQISRRVWKPSDPACCPSARKKLRYTWDPRTDRYTLAHTDRLKTMRGK